MPKKKLKITSGKIETETDYLSFNSCKAFLSSLHSPPTHWCGVKKEVIIKMPPKTNAGHASAYIKPTAIKIPPKNQRTSRYIQIGAMLIFLKIDFTHLFFQVLLIVFFLNKLNINPPIKAKYIVLFKGLEVMAQVPELHPTNFQYAYPITAPITAPIMYNLLRPTQFFILSFLFL